MEETVLKVALAGLMHDIGKVSQDVMGVSQDYLDRQAHLYQPCYDGRFTHRHVSYTAAFVESLEKILPPQLVQASWGLEDTFVNLTAGHHKPETPLQWIITIADRLSAGWDRSEFEKEYNKAIDWSDAKKTRLLSLFERVYKQKEGLKKMRREDFLYAYPLREISPENIFPQKKDIAMPRTEEEANEEYKRLYQEFSFALEKLAHRNENIFLWFDHLDSLMGIFLSNIPQARAGMVMPDVSLYDHSRIVAAISAALYLFHKETETYNVEAIKDYGLKKFLLICGDFYGIQNFIFSEGGESAKYRAKILRGRSFAVSLYCELAADLILRKIGLPSTSLVMIAGGKFFILAPNTPRALKELKEAERKINGWLIEISLGQSAIGISYIEASPSDFEGKKFGNLWEELRNKMWKRKFSRYPLEEVGGDVRGYLDAFRPLNPPLCPYCGKRPSSEEAELYKEDDRSMCPICHDHIFLGKNIVLKNKDLRMAITSVNADIKGEKLLAPIFGEYQVAFTNGLLNDLARSGELYKYWDLNVDPSNPLNKMVTVRFIAGYVPIYRDEDMYDDRILEGRKSEKKKERLIDEINIGSIKSFEHIAAKAFNYEEEGKIAGVSALGIFKADVDHLGKMIACGLPEDELSISRLSALSRQLNLFFVLYMPYLLKTDSRFNDIYTIFCGGDDLFLVGPWNKTIELASFLNEKFAEYVAHNEEIHFSAGISLQKPNTPIFKLAEDVEDALNMSKGNGRNSITVFGRTAKWGEFRELIKIKDKMYAWCSQGLVNSAMLFRLNKFIEMAEEEQRVMRGEGVAIKEMECLKWRAFFRYMTERNIGRTIRDETERKRAREEFSHAVNWLQNYRGKLRIPLWALIYNIRRGGRS